MNHCWLQLVWEVWTNKFFCRGLPSTFGWTTKKGIIIFLVKPSTDLWTARKGIQYFWLQPHHHEGTHPRRAFTYSWAKHKQWAWYHNYCTATLDTFIWLSQTNKQPAVVYGLFNVFLRCLKSRSKSREGWKWAVREGEKFQKYTENLLIPANIANLDLFGVLQPVLLCDLSHHFCEKMWM